MLLLEPFFFKPCAYFRGLYNVFEGLCLVGKVSSLKAEDTVCHGVYAFGGDILAYNLYKIGQRHYGSAHDKVVFSLLVFSA